MKRLSRAVIRLHSGLLRLYPAQFRREFADEMGEVFQQTVRDSHDKLSLLQVCAAELRDLPFSVIREHVRARRKTAVEVVIMNPIQPRPLFQNTVRASLLLFCLYCLIVIRPVLALNLDAQSVQAVYSGDLNVYYYAADGFFNYHPIAPEDEGTLRGFMQRDTLQALIMTLVGKAILFSGPVAAFLLGGILMFSLGKNWRSLKQRQRLIGGTSLIANASLLAFIFLPLGNLVRHWWG